MSKKKKRTVKLAPKETVNQRTSLYWAYGSNLNHRQMRHRCPRARPFGPLYLQGRLAFRYYADVETSDDKEDVVAGGLWRITPECEETLDRYEGVSTGHYEKRYLLLEIDGARHKVLYYRMIDPGVMPPEVNYLRGIREGYKDFGLDVRLLEEAVRRTWLEKDKTPIVMRRWEKYGRKKLAKIANAKAQAIN